MSPRSLALVTVLLAVHCGAPVQSIDERRTDELASDQDATRPYPGPCTIEWLADGRVAKRATFWYRDGQLVREGLDEDADGRLDSEVTYQHTGDRVSSEVRRFTEGAPQLVSYDYDDGGRVIAKEVHRGGRSETWRYAYGAGGRKTGEQHIVDGALETQTVLAYDDAGRLVSEATTHAGGAPASTVGYIYDADGRALRRDTTPGDADEPELRTTFEYDDAGRVTSETTMHAKGYLVERKVWTYDAAGNPLTISIGKQQVAPHQRFGYACHAAPEDAGDDDEPTRPEWP